MGWIKGSTGKCKIYCYIKATGLYELSAAANNYHTWQMKSLWDTEEECILYKNDSDVPLKINKLKVKTCSCNSGDSTYWSSQGETSTPCKGYGAKYYCRVRVTSETDTSKLTGSGISYKQTTNTPTVTVPNAGYNMNSKGSSSTNTAIFGNAPYEGNEGLCAREFTITDCPEIPPGGHAFVHIGIQNDSWASGATTSNSVIRFLLDTSFSEVTIEPVEEGYIWRYDKTEGKWKLLKPFYVYDKDNGKWVNVEEYSTTR